MKGLIKWGLPLAVAALVIAACGSREVETGGGESPGQGTMKAGQRALSVTVRDDALNAVYQQYLLLTTALIKADVAEAKIAALALEAGAAGVKGGSALAASAAKITAASGIEAQRSAYAALSDQLTALIKKAGLNAGKLYVDHCPMARNDKGANWVSPVSEIKNPYMGEEMLGCGVVKDTIE